MLEVLQGIGLTNVCCVVTRYFGGTLLGTCGLVRAYQSAVKEGLTKCEIVTRMAGTMYKVETDYGGAGKLQYLFGRENVTVLDSDWGQQVIFTIVLTKDQEGILSQITDTTGGTSKIEPAGETNVDVPWEVRYADGRDPGIN